jgi:hypothetical protein
MTANKKTVFQTALTAAVVAIGLAVSAGQMIAASSGTTAAGARADLVNAARMGQPVLTETVLNADDNPGVFAREASARDALGFPTGAKRAGKHVHDGIHATDYDEVDEVDGSGRPVALTQFDPNGHLVSAVRFDAPAASSPKVSRDSAGKTAAGGLKAAGVVVTGPYQADADQIFGGWDVHWDRSQDGVRVRGDETRVRVRTDGHIQSVATVEHDLAVAPATRIASDDATNVVSGQFDRWFAGRGSGYTIGEKSLEWVGPNATFDPAKLAATPSAYRLAWVVNVKPSGAAADYLSLVTMYVDAGDGSVLGGDVVE